MLDDRAPGENTSPALALVNTRWQRAGMPVESLPDLVAAERWILDRDLVGPGVPLVLTAADVERIHALREAVRELLTARIEQRAAAPEAIKQVNQTCAAVPMAAQLLWPPDALPRAVVTATARAGIPCALATIAADAIHLVSSHSRGRLLACGAPGCIRLLLSDHPRRAWCSTACGDRVRARRYHHRHRVEPRQPPDGGLSQGTAHHEP